MKQKLDKFKQSILINKNLLIFLIVLIFIGIIFGSVFALKISENDKKIITDYLAKFINDISENKLNYIDTFKNSIINNFCFIIVIWILGFSIIGIPVIIFMFFNKAFIIGFSIASFIVNYGFKGILYSLLYLLPGILLFLIGITILVIYSLSLSIKLLMSVIKKKEINFRNIFNKYLVILIIVVMIVLLVSLCEAFIMPRLFKLIINIFK